MLHCLFWFFFWNYILSSNGESKDLITYNNAHVRVRYLYNALCIDYFLLLWVQLRGFMSDYTWMLLMKIFIILESFEIRCNHYFSISFTWQSQSALHISSFRLVRLALSRMKNILITLINGIHILLLDTINVFDQKIKK